VSEGRRQRLLDEASRELCSAILRLSRAAPDACYYAYEALREARKSQRAPKPADIGKFVEKLTGVSAVAR
jgi:hypothetical protein